MVEMDNKTLRELQLVQLEILDVIDNICRNNNIPYSLYAGTLLGAVRHKGFIPWDDDLDICMSRRNYVKFIRAWKRDPVKGYVLQNKEIEPDFTQSFSKIRKDNTVFLEEGAESGNYHRGIFVDIFPIDRVPDGSLRRKIFLTECMLYQLYTREFAPVKVNRAVRIGSILLLKITPQKCRGSIRKFLKHRIISYNRNEQLKTIAIETFQSLRQVLPVDLLDEYVDLEFEGRDYMCFKLWDEYLTIKYGDYMQLPPEKDRVWKHRPLIIDFHKGDY